MQKNYFENVDLCGKNQTAKVLEQYYYNVTDQSYTSMIEEEKEELELPEADVAKEQAIRVVPIIQSFIIRTNEQKDAKYILDEKSFQNSFCGLHPFVDKMLVMVLADTFNRKETYDSNGELYKELLTSVEDAKRLWHEDTETEIVEASNSLDVSKLKIGMVVKNYKVLCGMLEQPIKTGDSRKAQLKDFKCYFDWEKSGQKFIITDVYDTPLAKEDKRKMGNNSIYVQYIEIILLQYLSNQKGYTRTFTKRNWWELLGVINNKYGKVSQNELKNLDYTVTEYEIKHFYQRCNKKLEEVLFSALNSLKSRRLIEYEMQTVIVKHDERGKEIYFEAGDEEKKAILEVERHVLRYVMGYDKMIQIFLKFKQKEFYEKVNDLLYKYYGWHHYYKQIKIIYTPEGVKQALPELEIKLQKEILNQKIVDYLNANAKDTYDKKLEQYEKKCMERIGEWRAKDSTAVVSFGGIWEVPDTYITAQGILTNELVSIGHKDMTFSMEEFLEVSAEMDELFGFDK